MLQAVSALFKSAARSLGFAKLNANLAIVGLDNSGKSTLLTKLQTGKLKSCPPTHRPSQETLQLESLTIIAWDIGGHVGAREDLWRMYVSQANGVLFVVDGKDRTRLSEAKQELFRVVTWLTGDSGIFDKPDNNGDEEKSVSAPSSSSTASGKSGIVAVFINKADDDEEITGEDATEDSDDRALSLEEAEKGLELSKLRELGVNISMFRGSVVNDTGYKAAITWLCDKIVETER